MKSSSIYLPGVPKISNPSHHDDGVGIAQPDGTIHDLPDRAYWDWSANISFALGIDAQNISTAARVWTNLASRMD
jgi:hypothetical protein